MNHPTIRHPSTRPRPQGRARSGFTLIELLVVISIISILAGMLIPAINLVRELANQTKCASNQRQIAMAMMVYANQNEGIWPVRATKADGSQDAANPTPLAFATTIGSFEFLATQMGELPRQLFSCPSEPHYRPTLAPEPTLDVAGPAISAWTNAVTGPGGNLSHSPAYAYDWSVPSNASSMRVVLADRGVANLAHKKLAVACFFDGHTGKLPRLAGAPVGATANLDGSAIATWQYLNPDASGATADDIYDPAGDDGIMVGPGTGSPTRTWVR